MNHVFNRWMAFLALMALLIVTNGLPTASAQDAQRCFTETGFCISGRLREYWEQNGALPVFGLPISEQREESIEGKPYQVQWFERNRLELHPENGRPYDVLIGRLGDDRLRQQGRSWYDFPKSGQQDGCRYFAETGQSVCGEILAAWRASGLELDGKRGKTEAENLALFGLPLSDLREETTGDGPTLRVQWFERARFELHPENQPPYNVLLGRLGAEVQAGGQAPAAAPVAAPEPAVPFACTQTPPAISGTLSQTCFKGGDEFGVVGTGFRPSESVRFQLSTPDGNPYEYGPIIGDGLARPDGTYHVSGALPPGVPAGIYSLQLRGAKSGNVATLPFTIIDGPPTAGDKFTLPASINAEPMPALIRRGGGRFVRFRTFGLPPGDNVGIYGTYPDGTLVGAEFQLKIHEDGGIDGRLKQTIEEDDPVGIYTTIFEVLTTGQKAIAYFRVLPEE